MIVWVVAVVSAVLLFMATAKLVSELREVLRNAGKKQMTTAVPRRRYSTSDEMRYILYGADDQFSPYDQQLLDYVRSHISQPSLTRPRRLANPLKIDPLKKDVSQVGQSTFVDKLLSGRQGGFFIECGAADGESYSNTLFFETERNWTGLLIEANPNYHRSLLDNNRRAYVLQACLSIALRPATVRMQPADLLGGIVDTMHQSHVAFIGNTKKPEVAVNCFPLNTIMAALDIAHVDYLSLDVEGPELEILQTIDWTRLHIDVITVEYRVYGGVKIGIDKPATLKRLKNLRQFFNNTGIYREVSLLPGGSDAGGLDVVFSRI